MEHSVLCFPYANRTFLVAELYVSRPENIRFCAGKHRKCIVTLKTFYGRIKDENTVLKKAGNVHFLSCKIFIFARDYQLLLYE